jgi:hypothetical protein
VIVPIMAHMAMTTAQNAVARGGVEPSAHLSTGGMLLTAFLHRNHTSLRKI